MKNIIREVVQPNQEMSYIITSVHITVPLKKKLVPPLNKRDTQIYVTHTQRTMMRGQAKGGCCSLTRHVKRGKGERLLRNQEHLKATPKCSWLMLGVKGCWQTTGPTQQRVQMPWRKKVAKFMLRFAVIFTEEIPKTVGQYSRLFLLRHCRERC